MEEKIVVPQRLPKSPGLAGFLGLFPFGAGAFYNGQRAKALLYLVVFAGLINAMDRHGSGAFVPLLFTGFIFFQFFDNIQSARAINEAAARNQEAAAVPLAEDVVSSGSIFWGALLIVVGLVLILANFEIISYAKLADLWPIAVIVIGLKLVAESIAKSKSNGQ
jgi:ABC-type polysaccharide/polyol phosphate export permease